MGDATSGLGRVSDDDGRGAWLQGIAVTIARGTEAAKRPRDAPKSAAAGVPAHLDATGALCALYSAHYPALVRMAVLLVGDLATAEQVVQDSLVAMHTNWRWLKHSDRALAYVRRCVINRSRSVPRHRVIRERGVWPPRPQVPSAARDAWNQLERSPVVMALRRLSLRQREVLVLRYYAGLSEAETASAMGISPGAVKSHTARAMLAIRDALEPEA